MTPTRTSKVSFYVNQDTSDDTILHCAICEIDIPSKTDWLLHANGLIRTHKTKENRCNSNTIVDEIIQQTRNALGEQNKFILQSNTSENVFKFICVLCDVELSSYFAVMDHVVEILHESRLKDYYSLKELKCNSSAKTDVESNTASAELRHDNPSRSSNTPLPTSNNGCVPESNRLQETDKPSRCENQAEIRPLSAKDVINVLSSLSCAYKGVLNCTFCNETVSFTVKEILDHDKLCKTSILPHSDERESYSSMISKFEKFCEVSKRKKFEETDATLLENVNPAMTTVSSLRHKVNQLETLSAFNPTIKIFTCLICRVTSGILEWEDHVLSNHSANFEDGLQITCLCLLCDKLLFGLVNMIADHEHFKTDNVHRLSCIAPAQFTKLLLPKDELPRYYKFVQKVSKIEILHEGKYNFYCSVCDFYGYQKVEKHFASAEHKFKANISNDLFCCEVCSIIIYGDRVLFEHHKLLPSHIFLKQKALKHPVDDCAIGGVESAKHKSLLSQLRTKIDQKCESNDYQFNNNFQCFAYFCSSCEYVTPKRDEWSQHLQHDEHTKKINVITMSKLFEYACVYCKLTIFGTIECLLKHTNSVGHELVKRLVTHRSNKQQLHRLLSTHGLSDSVPGLSDLLYRTIPKNAVNQSVPTNLSSLTKDNRVVDECKEKRALPEHLDSVECDDGTASLYLKKVNSQITSTTITVLRTFLQTSLEKCGQPKCKSFNCWFCGYFSSEKSWWSHLNHPTHMQKVLNHYKDSRTVDATVLFCRDCSVFSYGSKLIETLHIHSLIHRRKSKNENIPGRPRKRTRHLSGNRLLSSGSSSRERGEKMAEAFKNENTAETDGPSRADEHSSRRSLSVSSNISFTFENREKNNRSDDEYNNCDENIRVEEIEADEDGNEEEEEDQNDNICDILVQNESDVEPDKLMSEEELDESLLNELKRNMTSDDTPTTKSEQDGDVINEQEKEIIKQLIIIRGIPAQVLKNKKIMYSTFSRYGEIKRTFVKKNEPNSLYMLVEIEPEAMFKRLRKNIENLKLKLGTDELSIEHGTRNNDAVTKTTLSADAELLFSNRNELNEAINYLMLKYNKENDNAASRMKIKNLEEVVLNLATILYGKSEIMKVYVFGSRVTGLATENSDVDIYLQIGNTFRGSIHNITLLQQQLVVLFANTMRMYPQQFQNITSIPFARVPIVKFTHVATSLNCDLSFKSGLSTMNSILVRTYLELDDRVKYLICAVKLWSKLNDLADRNLFTTYAQIWMVLFFLMQADVAVIPTVLALRHMLPEDQKEFTVEGWNCSFPNVRSIVWRSTSTFSKEELLLKFFEFYSNVNLNNYVLCSLTGIKIEKKHFLKFYENLPIIFRHYKLKLQNDRTLLRIVQSDFEGLCIQDPFDHSHNLTKTINDRKFQCFVQICRHTVNVLNKNHEKK